MVTEYVGRRLAHVTEEIDPVVRVAGDDHGKYARTQHGQGQQEFVVTLKPALHSTNTVRPWLR